MKNKNRLISLIIILAGIVLICSGIGYHIFNNGSNNSTRNPKKEKITPLMYEVTKEGSDNKMYLFGSIHVADLSKIEMPKYILDAYNDSKYLALEYDLTKLNIEEELRQGKLSVYSDGTTLKDHLRESTYNKLIEYMNKNKLMDEDSMKNDKPFVVAQLITLYQVADSGLKVEDGIDIYFGQKALEDKKEILEVETAQEQFDLLASFPDRLYDIMIDESIKYYDESVSGLKELFEAWKKGDPDLIEQIESGSISMEGNEKYSESELKMFKEYDEALVLNRNISMAEKFDEFFNNNYRTFFNVGAAHLVGDNGIAALLTQKGYKVVQVNK